MKLQLFKQINKYNSRGVSSVIGVILLVAIVVLLATFLALFAGGFETQERAPQAYFEFEYHESVNSTYCSSDPCEMVKITHVGGDTFDPQNVDVVVYYMDGGTEKTYREDWVDVVASDIDASEAVRVWDNNPVDTLTTARIELIWISDDGSTSQMISDWEY